MWVCLDTQTLFFYPEVTRMPCFLILIDWLDWSFIPWMFEFLDDLCDPRAYRSITIHLFVYSLYQVSYLLLHLIHLSVAKSSLLHFQLNEWKSLIFPLIFSVSFLIPSIGYIAWFVNWNIWVFGLYDSWNNFLLVSFIMLWIWLMLVCLELWKFSFNVLYVKD